MKRKQEMSDDEREHMEEMRRRWDEKHHHAHQRAQGRTSVPREILRIAEQAVMDALVAEIGRRASHAPPSEKRITDAALLDTYLSELLTRLRSDPYDDLA